jgi:uncharacterized protein DUF4331
MKKPLRILGVLLALGVPVMAPAADHLDSPTASSNQEPTADITDLYAWTSADAKKLNLVMAVEANAQEGDSFSDAVIYQFAVSSSAKYGDPQESTLVTCKFADDVNIECWVGDDYVAGDPSDPEGIVSDNGGMRVFAGLRDDPFFLEYTGFNNAVTAAVDAVTAGEVEFEDAKQGCPTLTDGQATALVGALQHGANGAAPSNTFAGANVLALVIELDTSLVDGNGPLLGVSAATYTAN